MMGLGSIVGTGVFVSIGIAAGVAGPAVILSIAVAAIVAACNGLSSAQLAANHPVSGGTYEYGYRWLHPSLGFTAGWMFLCAKSASAATAALVFAGYVLNAFGQNRQATAVPLALATVLVLTLLVLSGIRRSSITNTLIVSITLLSLTFFVVAGLPRAFAAGAGNLTPFFVPEFEDSSPLAGFLEACALMFVAYTGYGRIATLGEEIHNPNRNIPIAIILTLMVSMALYISVGLVSVAAVGAQTFAAAGTEHAALLEIVARQFNVPGAALVVAVGAATAMLGVLLNLTLGLSRVVLAMGRRRDIPSFFAKIGNATPYPAVIFIGGVIAGLVLIGDVKTLWSFSAFTVLIYYAVTNLAAICLNDDERLYPRLIPWTGLFLCLFLAFWVEPLVWMIGLGLIAVGLIWHSVASRLA
ncbi:MAG: amino acid permease [Planctomycetes bacterium]|nr:amino acid permease [Planctomycetota bacterium]